MMKEFLFLSELSL